MEENILDTISDPNNREDINNTLSQSETFIETYSTETNAIVKWGDISSHYSASTSYQDNKCPTKAQLLARPLKNANEELTIKGNYADNQLVKFSDLSFTTTSYITYRLSYSGTNTVNFITPTGSMFSREPYAIIKSSRSSGDNTLNKVQWSIATSITGTRGCTVSFSYRVPQGSSYNGELKDCNNVSINRGDEVRLYNETASGAYSITGFSLTFIPLMDLTFST